MISSGDTVVRSDELSVGPFGERFEIAQRGGFVDALVAHERRPQRLLASLRLARNAAASRDRRAR
jgi:antitoxin (DNA-binding transcriptional repressor) of toxin-antitoxin stability system